MLLVYSAPDDTQAEEGKVGCKGECECSSDGWVREEANGQLAS